MESEPSELAIGGFGAMLALVVMFGNVHRYPGIGCSEEDAAVGETRNVLEEIGVFDGLGGGFAPGERGVTGDQDAGDGDRVEAAGAESADDDLAGRALVGFGHLLGGEEFGDRNRAMEVVGVGGAEAGNGAAGLRPGGCKLGVGVDDAADLGELAVEASVCIQVT